MVSIDFHAVDYWLYVSLILIMILVIIFLVGIICFCIYHYRQKIRKLLICEKIVPFSTGYIYDKPSGFKNLAETCYMNAIIQAAASSQILISQFQHLHETYKESMSLKCFYDVLIGVNTPDDSYERLCKNTNQLETLIRLVNWTKTNQQDAFELFTVLIKGISDEFKAQNIDDIEMPLKLKMVYRFKGLDIPDRTQYHLGLSLGLSGPYETKPGVTLEFLILEHFSPTLIDGDPNKTSQLFFLKDAPDVLLLHIQANKWDSVKEKMIKPKYHIVYEREMTIWFDIITALNKDNVKRISVTYRLTAVVQHMGTISGGHYVAYRKWRNNWYLVSDEQVELMEFSGNICPYILIYEKIGSAE